MRVIAGNRKGSTLAAPSGIGTRPTADRVKEAIFNIIQAYMPAKSVLDLFCGSGALGIEALSRGCEGATLVDSNKSAINTTLANLHKTRFEAMANVVNKEALDFLKQSKEEYDIIFLDPPYGQGYIGKVFEILKVKNTLSKAGIIVAESDICDELPTEEYFRCLKRAAYGSTAVSIWSL